MVRKAITTINPTTIKERKHNSPENKTFMRVLKLVLAVAATVGKNIRKRICEYTGIVILKGT
jgi:hypothetical protein